MLCGCAAKTPAAAPAIAAPDIGIIQPPPMQVLEVSLGERVNRALYRAGNCRITAGTFPKGLKLSRQSGSCWASGVALQAGVFRFIAN